MTPSILRLGDILLTSVQADLSDEYALQLQTDLLQQLNDMRYCGVVMDVSALDVIDSYMARVLTDTVRMVQLMGSDMVITGMQPLVAMTLIEMGRELKRVQTALTLEKGIARLRARQPDAGKPLEAC